MLKKNYERHIREAIEDSDLQGILETNTGWIGKGKSPNFGALNKGTLVFLFEILEKYERMLKFIRSQECTWCGAAFTHIDDIEYDDHDPPKPMCSDCWHEEMWFPCHECGEMVFKPDVDPSEIHCRNCTEIDNLTKGVNHANR